jgi:hypothetical protein
VIDKQLKLWRHFHSTSKMTQSNYKVSDFLKDRHPYREVSFEQVREDNKYKVFDSFGHDGLKRNINALQDENFAVDEKRKALKLIFAAIRGTELRLRALELGVVDSMIYLLKQNISEEFNELCSKIIDTIVDMPQAKEEICQKNGVGYLLRVVKNVKSRTQLDRRTACKALYQISMCDKGCKLLIDDQDPEEIESQHNPNTSRVITMLVWVMKEQLTTDRKDEILLNYAISTLARMCTVPRGRDISAATEVLPAADDILRRKDVGLAGNDPDLLDTTLSTCQLIWNVCLDGEGKKQARFQMKTLGYVLYHAIKYEQIRIVQLVSGTFTSILVYEEGKFMVEQDLGVESGENIIDILCRLLAQLLDKESSISKKIDLLNQKGQFRVEKEQLDFVPFDCGFDKYMEDNIVAALKSMSEWPKARNLVRSKLDSFNMRNVNILARIFPKREED